MAFLLEIRPYFLLLKSQEHFTSAVLMSPVKVLCRRILGVEVTHCHWEAAWVGEEAPTETFVQVAAWATSREQGQGK